MDILLFSQRSDWFSPGGSFPEFALTALMIVIKFFPISYFTSCLCAKGNGQKKIDVKLLSRGSLALFVQGLLLLYCYILYKYTETWKWRKKWEEIHTTYSERTQYITERPSTSWNMISTCSFDHQSPSISGQLVNFLAETVFFRTLLTRSCFAWWGHVQIDMDFFANFAMYIVHTYLVRTYINILLATPILDHLSWIVRESILQKTVFQQAFDEHSNLFDFKIFCSI